MKFIIYISLFVTVFTMVLAFFSIKKDDATTTAKKKLSITDLLKSWNNQLKSLLVKKKSPTKKNHALARRLSVAGLPIKPEEFIAFRWMAAFIIGGLFQIALGQLLLALVGFFIGFIFPNIWLKQKEQKRLNKFNAGLPNMLTSIIGSLRAGFSFVQSLQLVAEEADSPIKEEVETLLKTMQYGKSMEDAMVDWKERMPSEDLELLVEAILIQRQVGGNLAYLLDKIVETTREREKIQNQIKTLTAQGRLSGIVISALPVVLGLIIYVINPDYIMTLFTNPIGLVMVSIAFVGAVIGFMFIRKITTIEV